VQKPETPRRGLLTLRRDLATIEGEVGQRDAALLVGTTERSWSRWKAGQPITAIPRAAVRNLALLTRIVDMRELMEGRAELSQSARIDLEYQVRDRLEAQAEGVDEPAGDPRVLGLEHRPPDLGDALPRPEGILAGGGVDTGNPRHREREAAPPAPAQGAKRQEPAPGSLVRVRFHDGYIEDVTPARAARLLEAGEAELPENTSDADAESILVAHEKRQAAMAERLKRDYADAGPPANRFGQAESSLSRFQRRGF